MTKKRKTQPQLYDHNTSPTVHRNLTVTDDGRRRRTASNYIDVPSILVPADSVEEDGHRFDDNYIPVNPENPESLSGVQVKVTPAKRYENSVRQFNHSNHVLDLHE